MDKPIVNKSFIEYQLISIGIDLANQVVGLRDCDPVIALNPRVVKAAELAQKWIELFFDSYLHSERSR